MNTLLWKGLNNKYIDCEYFTASYRNRVCTIISINKWTKKKHYFYSKIIVVNSKIIPKFEEKKHSISL